jgi:hypothetical protein
MLVLVGWDLLPYPIFEFISGPSDQNSDQSGPKWNARGHFNIRARTDPMIWIQTQRLGYFRRSELWLVLVDGVEIQIYLIFVLIKILFEYGWWVCCSNFGWQ